VFNLAFLKGRVYNGELENLAQIKEAMRR